MGIPSYFSYIIKNHKGIFKKRALVGIIDNFYLDSNSIIYDSIKCVGPYTTDKEYEEKLIINVIKIINDLMLYMKPTGTVFITFDGVAPLAKIKQQKTRRFKTHYTNKLLSELTGDDVSVEWDKTAITPGTKFMERLSITIRDEYVNNDNVLVSCSDEIGEGEHKIFNYIRKNDHKDKITVVYGLDADLIMLCLNNLNHCTNLFVCREAPEFIKALNYELEPNELYFLDMYNFKDALTCELMKTKKKQTNNNIVYDYTFICFLLGNDFMPHFPSLNIRTTGIDVLMTGYYTTTKGKYIINGKSINWGVFRNLVKWLAENEEYNIKNEYIIRNKMANRRQGKGKHCKIDTVENSIENIPLALRDDEILIDPNNIGWENRYYLKLFDSENTEEFVKKVCINYLEGLEWVMKYYTEECVDWMWKYKYNYPPLFKDLLKYVPHWNVNMLKQNNNKPLPPIAQLAYVIPKQSFHLLPPNIVRMLKDKYIKLYDDNVVIKWSFCRYFWEAHVDFPYIDMGEFIEDILKLNTN